MAFHKRLPPVGSRPGTLAIPDDAQPTRIHLFDYQGEICTELDLEDVDQLGTYVDSERVTWVDVQGFANVEALWRIADLFSLHPLTLEDATNVPQRAKSEVHASHHVLVARAPDPSIADRVEVPQVFLLLGRHFLLTFQDHYFGYFEPVRRRIREGIGPIRQLGPDYLAYALLDTMVDHYFPRLEICSERIEELEERVYTETSSDILEDLHRARRELVVMRRVGWPQREALHSLVTVPSPFVDASVIPYLQSTEQHLTQAMEAVDSARETATGLVELYLSNVSQRTNEIMKVLTLMASIFIPLTFIAGIYGMNFEHMPELQSRSGYFIVIGVMVVMALGMVAFFFRRGWLGNERRRTPKD